MPRLSSRAARLQASHRRRQEALYPERFRQDGLLEQEADIERTGAQLRRGIKIQLGFLAVLLAGFALVFVTPAEWSALHRLIERLANWL
jgi:hypothetical protein